MDDETSDSPILDFPRLLDGVRNGDADSINQVFKHFYPQVQRAVHLSLATDLRLQRPWLHARFSTGDVVQEVFQSVLRDLSTFDGSTEKAFGGFLSVVVRNRIVDAIRFHEAERRDGRAGQALDVDPTAAGEVTDLVSAEEERAQFQKAVATFSEKEQLLLRARFEDTAPFIELTEMLGYPNESATRRAFLKAQTRLAVLLEGDAVT